MSKIKFYIKFFLCITTRFLTLTYVCRYDILCSSHTNTSLLIFTCAAALELILSKLTPENGSLLDHFRVLMSAHSAVVVVFVVFVTVVQAN